MRMALKSKKTEEEVVVQAELVSDDAPLKTEELITFTKALTNRYLEVLGCEEHTLHKLKEIWVYIMENFPEEKKICKSVKKANKISEFLNAINCLPEL